MAASWGSEAKDGEARPATQVRDQTRRGFSKKGRAKTSTGDELEMKIRIGRSEKISENFKVKYFKSLIGSSRDSFDNRSSVATVPTSFGDNHHRRCHRIWQLHYY